jgi:hypothetical protein
MMNHENCGGKSESWHQTEANGQLHAAFCSPQAKCPQYPQGSLNGTQSRYQYEGAGYNQLSVVHLAPVTLLTAIYKLKGVITACCEFKIRNSPENNERNQPVSHIAHSNPGFGPDASRIQ